MSETHRDESALQPLFHWLYIGFTLQFRLKKFDNSRQLDRVGEFTLHERVKVTRIQVTRPSFYFSSEAPLEKVQRVYRVCTYPFLCRLFGHNCDKLQRIIHNGLLLLYATDTLHDIVNVTAVKDWEASCYSLTRSSFSEAVSALYVRQYAPKYLETLAKRVIYSSG